MKHKFKNVAGTEIELLFAETTWQNFYWYQGFKLGEDDLQKLGYLRITNTYDRAADHC